MICFSISAPFPWGTRARSGYCSQGERLHSGRDPNDSQGGTGKAEDAKQPGAGIIPKPCPRKGAAEMENLTDLSTNLIGPEAEDQQGNARSISGASGLALGRTSTIGPAGSVHNRP